MLAEGVVLAAAAAAAFALRRDLTAHVSKALALVGILAIVGMGIQNALMRLVYGGQTQTTVMTGNVTQLFADAARILTTSLDGVDAEPRAGAIARIRNVGVVMLGFVLGAAAGAALTSQVGVTSLALPALVVLTLALCEEHRPARSEAGGSTAQ